MTLSLTVLVSGTGSNLGAILAAIDAGTCDACVRAVISDRSQAKGLSLATERNIATAVIKLADYPSRPAWDDALTATVQNFDPDVVVLAGFMKIIGAPMVAAFAGRILNVHPSLLPAFPGTEAPARALAAGACITGCTVHVVDGGVDTGPIVAQAAVRVHKSDDPQTLHERIQRAEHRLFPAVLDAIARGRIGLGEALCAPPVTSEGIAQDDGSILLSPKLDAVP